MDVHFTKLSYLRRGGNWNEIRIVFYVYLQPQGLMPQPSILRGYLEPVFHFVSVCDANCLHIETVCYSTI
jgi:hypothetical protein